MIMPYVRFNGNCEEAFLWYSEIFNGKINHMLKYHDIWITVDKKQQNFVAHAQIMLTNNGGVSGADSTEPIENDRTIFIQAHLDDEKTARKIFYELSSDGKVLSDLQKNPPPDDNGISGCVTDKFGITWIISALI